MRTLPRALVEFLGAILLGTVPFTALLAAEEDTVTQEIRATAVQLAKAYNAGKASDVAALFLPQGELVDEEGTVYQGRKEIGELFQKFFARFPGVQLTLSVESVRSLGGQLAMEEGTRVITAKIAADAGRPAQLRYSAVRTKVDGKWYYASVREFNDDPSPTPRDYLQPLEWLVGDWVNEGSDAVVKITYRWSDDGNYLLGDYEVNAEGQATMKSTQRIGWDPLHQRIRSWIFDADGGFSEGQWTPTDTGWLVKNTAVLPDGQTSSATVTLTVQEKGAFEMAGRDRVIGGSVEADFQVRIVRKPPVAAK